MRWRTFALALLGVNIALAAVWVITAHRPAGSRAGVSPGQGEAGAESGKPRMVLRRQFFSWREVESADYPTYIANLRDIGCPEQTIRDIIIADVNALYSRKRATELVTPEQQWWRSEADPEVVQAAAQKARVLEEERRGLLTRLLGTNWEAGDLVNLPRPTRPGLVLDGPLLGGLPPETKQTLQDISARAEERMQTYLDAQRREGKNPDPVEMAKLRQQTRNELARVLTPQQAEEFLLRYSQNATELRAQFGQLRFFNASAEEFRGVFRAIDGLDQQLQLLGDSNNPDAARQRKTLEEQRENAIKVALGAKRYEEYQLLQDPLYRDAVAKAEEAGTPEAARTFYAINLAAAAEQERIRADATLSEQQRAVELKRLELEQLKANTLASGQDLPPDPQEAPKAPPKKTHLVRQGDTPAIISLLYGVPIGAIQAANPQVSLNKLKQGDVLTIPPNPLVPPSASTP